MEEVLEKLENTDIVESKEPKSEYESLYKNRGKLGNQEERRRSLLEVQKSNRNAKVDKFRGILDLVQEVEDTIFRNSHRGQYRPNIFVAGFSKVSQTYRNVLMLSEWMVEKPEDFCDEWYLTPCPKGVRLLVIATGGRTQCFTKYGHFKFEIRTALPGGNQANGKERNQCCILDCFYQEKNNTMYILDLLAWNNQPMTDCDTEFRRFWLQSKMAELPQLKIINKNNAVVFTLLPMIPCNKDALNMFLMTYPAFECNFPPLDGFLFYHKKTHYVSGETPLVGWLFPYMVPEVLGEDIKINDGYMAMKPAGYTTQAEFIEKFDAKYSKKKHRIQNNSMDVTDEQEKEDGDKASNESTMKVESTEKTEKNEPSDTMEAEEIVPKKEEVDTKISSLIK